MKALGSSARASTALASLALLLVVTAACRNKAAPAARAQAACPGPEAGLSLPPGFCATIFADKLGHVRHMAVARDGTLYANSLPDTDDPALPSGLILLRDSDGDGHADMVERPVAGMKGGTGIALHDGALLLEDGDRILRYRLDPATHRPGGQAEPVVTGLATTGDHDSHSIAITPDGALFVNSGSATNACQIANRQPGSRGEAPCAEKALRAGIWRFDAAGTGQPFTPAARYASGIRNAVGLAIDGKGRLFATQHGRDQLHENWEALYSARQGQELPAEELIEVSSGADYGWPECYYDPGQRKLVLAPEYGGDGGKAVGPCASRRAPIAAFPAHWAPNALAIYEGAQFPAAYRGGAFIAFHGSWNRAPGPQQGFNIVFQPMRDGRPTGTHILFADGFAGPERASGKALHRPTGLAIGPDGALYVSDDKAGRIWRITYHGDAAAPLIAAKAAASDQPPAAAPSPEAAAATGAATGDAATIALGRQLYAGAIAGATCTGCHGPNGEGSAIAPRLNDGEWLWGDGSLADIRGVIAHGVPRPKRYPAPMPPGGGATLTDAQIDALAAYVRSLSHPAK